MKTVLTLVMLVMGMSMAQAACDFHPMAYKDHFKQDAPFEIDINGYHYSFTRCRNENNDDFMYKVQRDGATQYDTLYGVVGKHRDEGFEYVEYVKGQFEGSKFMMKIKHDPGKSVEFFQNLGTFGQPDTN